MLIEKCKCGGNIHSFMLLSMPPIHVKECTVCGKKQSIEEEIEEVIVDLDDDKLLK